MELVMGRGNTVRFSFAVFALALTVELAAQAQGSNREALLDGASPGPASLIWVGRRAPEDRVTLIRAGVTLVAEQERSLLALGDLAAVARTLECMGYSWGLADADVEGWDYYSVHMRGGAGIGELAPCADLVLSEGNWALLRAPAGTPRPCPDSERWRMRRLPLKQMAEPLPPPPEYEGLGEGASLPSSAKPLVQEIANLVTPTLVQGNWNEIINAATTRYSTSSGCATAAQKVYDKFSALGLNPVKQFHTAGHAPNIVGAIAGKVTPAKVCIVVGHVDDMPETGPAPGANDNASGAAMVTSAAQAMAAYTFASTVKFLVVTGEEFDLDGSTYYADRAQSQGEQIQGVLDADMIGWEGDGQPSSENIDVDCNSASLWLGQLLSQCAADYSTGCPVNYFLCPIADYSDHYPFWVNGFSAIMGITDNEGDCNQDGTYDYYHTADDTKAQCGDPTFFNKAVKAYAATLAHMADPLCKPPAPPNGFTANALGANIVLSWTPSAAGLNHEIYRAQGTCTGAVSFSRLGESSTGTYTDTSPVTNTRYAYKVYSKDSTGYCVSATAPCAEGITSGTSCSLSCTATVPSAGTVGSTVSFQATATPSNCSGSPTYAWTFGDGATSTQQNPSHAYSSAGSFNWSMTAAVQGVTCSKQGSITIVDGCSLTCAASVTASSGSVPLSVDFSATSTGTNCPGSPSYSWDFGDGGTSSQRETSHTYQVPGVYGWTLTVTHGGERCTSEGTVTANAPPCSLECSASADPTSGQSPLQVRFASTFSSANCSGQPEFNWSFGDGQNSSEQNPAHTYAKAGVFTWSVTVTADGESCGRGGTVEILQRAPGDCDGDGAVGIGEVQRAINMFLGIAPPECGADCDGDGTISIGELQKVINSFLGLVSTC